jgi:hypothetical protein
VEPWVIPLTSLIIGLAGGGMGAYIGMRIGLVRLEVYMEDAKTRLDQHSASIAKYNEDLLIHDLELEDIMRDLTIPRKRRQNWRFGS